MKQPTRPAAEAAPPDPPQLRTWLRRFAMQFLPGAALISATTVLVVYFNASSNLALFRERERVHAEVGASAPAAHLRHALDDVWLLGRDEAILAWAATGDTASMDRLVRRFADLVSVTGRYDQVRWIDEHGLERLRVDYVDGRARQVPEPALQDKSDRYYFREAVDLPVGALYVSPLDLNIEHGRIELPHKPVVRVATPVARSDGERRGVVVVNYLAQAMLDRIVEVVGDSRSRLGVANEAGHWLHGPDPARNWGFMFDRPPTLPQHHPDAWRAITQGPQGQRLLADGLWTWSRVDLDLGDAANSARVRLDLRIVLHADNATLGSVRREGAPTLLAGTLVILLAYAALSAQLTRTSIARETSEARAARLHADAQAERRLRASDAQRLAAEVRLGEEQARSREAAERSSREWRQLAEAMPQLVWTCDAEGTCDYLSRQWLDYTGIPEAPQLGFGWLEQVHVDDRQHLVETWNRSVATLTPFDVEFRIRRHDGVYRWFKTRATPITDAHGHVLRWYGSNTDIDDLKRTENAVRASELRFRTIYETTPVSIWEEDWSTVIVSIEALRAAGIHDIAGYCDTHPSWVDDMMGAVRILDVNQRTVEMFCATDKSQILASLSTVFATEDTRPGFITELIALAEGRRMFATEMSVNTVPGERLRVLLMMAFPEPGSGSGKVFVTVIDITEKHRIAQELEQHRHHLETLVERSTAELREANAALASARDRAIESEQRFRSAFQSAAIGMALVSLEGRFVEVNAALCGLTGYDADELLARTFQDITHPDDLDADLSLVADLMAKRRSSYQLEKRYLRKGGDVVWVLLTGSTVEGPDGAIRYFIAQIQDITARKRAEASLRASENFLRTVTDALPGMVGYWDTDLRCRFANAAYRAWFGTAPEQATGLRMADLVGEEMYRALEPHARAALAGESRRFEHRFVRPDGSGGYAWAQYIPDRENGTVRGFYVLASDVSDLKDAQIALQEANDALQARTRQAEAASRAKSRFVANMSHEIRTPMNAVLGLVQLLDETPLDKRQQDYVRKIRKSSKALLVVLNDILDYSKIEAGRMQLESVEFRLDDVLDSVSDLFAAAAEQKGLELFLRVAPDVPRQLIGDPLRLGQILNNLVGNAIKFTARGEVRIVVECVDCAAAQATLRFAVEDTGIGLSVDEQAGLFEAFAQADPSTTRRYGGSGLGLVISKGLVELMHGAIAVDSRPGTGSRFHFTVMLTRGHESGDRTLPRALHGLRALIVDDRETSRTILADILASWRVERVPVASASAARQALRDAAAAGRPFRLALIDRTLPDADGVELARQIAAAVTDTAIPPLQCVLMATEAGMAPNGSADAPSPLVTLTKPVTASRLFELLTSLDIATPAADTGDRDTWPALRARAAPIVGARVLVVEDNAVNRQVAHELIEQLGLQVDTVADGAAAVARVAETDYDMILMDLQMPDLDGLEATRRIRAAERGRHLPIVAMTAAAMSEDREEARAAGMDDHLVKPIDTAQLLDTLMRWIAPRAGARPLTPTPGASPAPTGGPPLPTLDGFDLRAALSRLAGRDDLLLRLLREFAEQCRESAAALRAAQADADDDRLARLLHALKGSAAGVGAIAVQQLAAAQEAHVAAGRRLVSDALPTLLISTAEAITGAMAATPPVARKAHAADAKALRPALLALAELIRRHRAVSMAELDSLRQHADVRGGGEIASLIRSIENYEYDVAGRQIGQLLDSLP